MCHKIDNLFSLQISSEFIGIWFLKSIVNITSSLKFAFNIKLEEQGILDKTEKARGNMMTVFQKKKQNIKKEEESSFIFYI